MLEGNNFTFKPLMKHGALDLGQVMAFTVKVSLIFILEATVLSWYPRFAHDQSSVAIAVIIGIITVLPNLASVLALFHIGCLPKDHKKEARLSGHLYWSFWPFWTLFFSITALVLGVLLGEHLWTDLYRYYELSELRHYKNVNPAKTPGQQMKDAGVVTFASGVGLERGHGGCFVNGDT
jgi:hypothetical protein